MNPANIVRFLEKVAIGEHCWTWTGATAGEGYGVTWDSEGRRQVYAHRFAHELFLGPIPEGLEVDHLCRNRLCVKPTHIEAVTGEENKRRARERAGRLDHCPHGHPFDDVNTYVAPSGARNCRECARRRRRRSTQRQETSA